MATAKPEDEVDSGDLSITDFYGERESDEIRIVLVGRTGSGKSATGNTLLGREKFISKSSGSSVTEKCQIGKSRYTGSCSKERKLHFVDTPGLFDTELSHKEQTREMIRCIHMSLPGPHIFLIVLRIDRFTKEEIQSFNSLLETFGEDMSKFAIIIFTRLDDLEHDGKSIEAFIEGSNEELRDFIELCGHRYIAFNNRSSEKDKREKMSQLMVIIDRLIRKNNGNHYSNSMFKAAEANLQKKIREVQRIEAFEKAKEMEKIESKFKVEINNLQQGMKSQTKDLQTKGLENQRLKLEIENLQTEQLHAKKSIEEHFKEQMKTTIRDVIANNNETVMVLKKEIEKKETMLERSLAEKEKITVSLEGKIDSLQQSFTVKYDLMEAARKAEHDLFARMQDRYESSMVRQAESYQQLIQNLQEEKNDSSCTIL